MNNVLTTRQPKLYLTLSISLFLLSFLIVCYSLIRSDLINKDFVSFLTFFILLICILWYFSKKDICNRWILYGIFFTFIVRSFYAYNIYTTEISPFPDSFKYLNGLQQMQQANNFSVEVISNIAQSLQFAYYYLIFGTYSIFHTIYSLYLVNIFLFSISLILFYQIIVNDFGKKVAIAATSIALLSTNLFLFTSNILKDSLVLFLTMLCLYLYKKKNSWILLTVGIMALFTARIYTGLALVVAIFIDILLNKWKYLKLYQKVWFLMIVVTASFLVTISNFSSNYLYLLQVFINSNGIGTMILKSPLAVLKMFFAPLPWNVSKVEYPYTITVIDSCFTMVFSFTIVLFFIKWCKDKELRRKMYLYIIPIWIHALALGVTYDGDSTRQRIAVFFSIILMYAIGVFYKSKNKNAIVR